MKEFLTVSGGRRRRPFALYGEV